MPSQQKTERALIRDAAQRLIGGSPLRSNGKITVTALAVEAGISRQRLYEHHADLVAEFKSDSHGTANTPNFVALQQQFTDAQTKIRELEARTFEQAAQIKTLCAIITELTVETRPDNVLLMPTITTATRPRGADNV